MATAREQLMQGLSPEQWEALHAYRMALRLHDGRYLAQPRVVSVAAPAAGVDWTAFVPSGVTWQLFSIEARLATSAVVAARFARLVFSDGTREFFRDAQNNSESASQSWVHSWFPGSVTTAGGNGAISHPFPAKPPILFGGTTVATVTTNIDVGDQWSAITLYVLEVRERTANEMVSFAEDIAEGRHVDLYPGLLLGL